MLNTTECVAPARQTTADICRQIDETIEELLVLSDAINRFVTGEEDMTKEPVPDIRCFNDDLANKDRALRKVRGKLRCIIEGMGINV